MRSIRDSCGFSWNDTRIPRHMVLVVSRTLYLPVALEHINYLDTIYPASSTTLWLARYKHRVCIYPSGALSQRKVGRICLIERYTPRLIQEISTKLRYLTIKMFYVASSGPYVRSCCSCGVETLYFIKSRLSIPNFLELCQRHPQL
jgi:hypothetical protein